MFLFRAPGSELLSVSLGAISGMAVALGLCFTLFALMVAKSLRAKVTTGQEGLVGLDVEITEDLVPEGMVKCHGEVWRARVEDEAGPLRRGAIAQVTATEGITLIVGPKEPGAGS
jgi:membrane-bound serine protease (ClpP class)